MLSNGCPEWHFGCVFKQIQWQAICKADNQSQFQVCVALDEKNPVLLRMSGNLLTLLFAFVLIFFDWFLRDQFDFFLRFCTLFCLDIHFH